MSQASGHEPLDAALLHSGLGPKAHSAQVLDESVFMVDQRKEALVFLGECRDQLLLLLAHLHRHRDVEPFQNLSELLVAGQVLTDILLSLALESLSERRQHL